MKHRSRPFFGRAQPAFRSTMKPFTLGSQPLVPPAMDFLRGRDMELVKSGHGFGIVDLETGEAIIEGSEFDEFLEGLELYNEDGTLDAESLIDLLGKAARSKGGRFEISAALEEELGVDDADTIDSDGDGSLDSDELRDIADELDSVDKLLEAMGRGDLPQRPPAPSSIAMQGPEDLPYGTFLDQDYDENDDLEPGEEFKLLEFELDLQEFINDPESLKGILGKAQQMGGITVHFRSSKDKLLGLASHIHGTGGPGPSFTPEEFAEFNLFPVDIES